MIIYITLAYGLIVTAGAVGVYLLMRGEVRNLTTKIKRIQRQWSDEINLVMDQRDVAQTKLGAIKLSRHNAAVKARAAQIAQRKAQVLAKAAELQVDRIAA